MKKFLTIFLILGIINLTAVAVEFDSSIDASIRKDFNVETNELPALPNAVPTTNPVKTEISTQNKYNYTGKIYTLKRGTKINLTSTNKISDWMHKGSQVTFSSNGNIYTKEGTLIPSGTIFKGIVTDSHRPQITGNGGLVELKIDEIYFNGIMSKIDTKVSMANSKRIFLSNIKGKRSYWKNFSKVMTPGKKVFSATHTCAMAMMPIPVVNLFSIIPLAGGGIVYTLNLVTAPIITIFTKGGSLSLPAGTQFQIKITDEVKIKG